jgi:hypothetical protein
VACCMKNFRRGCYKELSWVLVVVGCDQCWRQAVTGVFQIAEFLMMNSESWIVNNFQFCFKIKPDLGFSIKLWIV